MGVTFSPRAGSHAPWLRLITATVLFPKLLLTWGWKEKQS